MRELWHEGQLLAVSLDRDITARKRVEDELRTSEERFRTLVQFSFDVYWESRCGTSLHSSRICGRARRRAGTEHRNREDPMEVPYLEPDAEACEKHRETLNAPLASFRDFESARPAPDGGKRYVSVSGLPIFDETGRFIGYRGVGRHITERKKAESELRDSQKKLEAAQRIAHVGWWERDFSTNRVSLSDEVCRTFGVRPVDLPEWHERWLGLMIRMTVQEPRRLRRRRCTVADDTIWNTGWSARRQHPDSA